MSDEKLASLMNEARMISASENIIFPMIQLKIKQRIDLACAKFTGGETQFIADIAFIQGLKDMESSLKKSIEAGNKANFELNKQNIK